MERIIPRKGYEHLTQQQLRENQIAERLVDDDFAAERRRQQREWDRLYGFRPPLILLGKGARVDR